MSRATPSRKRSRVTTTTQHDAPPEAPQNTLLVADAERRETGDVITLRQGFTGDVLCQACRGDLLSAVAALLQQPTVLIRLASKLVAEGGTQSWSWKEISDESVELPQKSLVLIRHDGRWSFLDHIRRRLDTATCIPELLLPLFMTRWGVPEPLAVLSEGRKAFQERLLVVTPTLPRTIWTSRACPETETLLTEWTPADHDMASLLICMEMRGRDLFRLCHGDHATFVFQQIVGYPSRSYFVWLLQRAVATYSSTTVPKALGALHLACGKEPEYGFTEKPFTWSQNPVLRQGLAMQDEWGALALRLYFDLHDVCPRIVHVSFPEASCLLALVKTPPNGHYQKYLLEPVLKRLAFSGCVREAGALTCLFVETLDDESTEKDVCKWIEHFWHLDVQQLLEAVGRPVLSIPTKVVQSSWSTNPQVLTTHRLLEREYKLHAHNDVLPWTEFVTRATATEMPSTNMEQKTAPTLGRGKKRKPACVSEDLVSR